MKSVLTRALFVITAALLTSCAPQMEGDIVGDIHNFGPNQRDGANDYLMGTFEDGKCIALVEVCAATGWSPKHYNTKASNGVIKRTISWSSGDREVEFEAVFRSQSECFVNGNRYNLSGGRLIVIKLLSNGDFEATGQARLGTEAITDADTARQAVWGD